MALRPIDWCTIQTILILGASVLLYFIGGLFPVQSGVNEEAFMIDHSRQPPWPLWVLSQASLAYFAGLYTMFQPPLVRVNDVLTSASVVAAMDVARQLRLSEAFANRAMTAEEIADAKDVDVGKLDMLLQVLSDAGFFQRDPNDHTRWRNNAQSMLLRDEHPNSVTAAVRYAASSLSAYSTLCTTVLPANPNADNRGEQITPDSLWAAQCSKEKDAGYVLSSDINWKKYHRVIAIGGCGMLMERVHATHPSVLAIPVLNSSSLLQITEPALKELLKEKIGSLRWGDVVVVQSLNLMGDTQVEELIKILNELCMHSGAQLFILDPLLVDGDASSNMLNARRRRDAVQLMLHGGMLRSTASMDALLTRQNWIVDEIIETRSEFVGMIASSNRHHHEAE